MQVSHERIDLKLEAVRVSGVAAVTVGKLCFSTRGVEMASKSVAQPNENRRSKAMTRRLSAGTITSGHSLRGG